MVVRQDVVRPARRLELRRHAPELAEERIRLELAAERRRVAVAGVDDRVAAVALDEPLDRGDERAPVAAGEVDAADRALEQEIAREDVRADAEGDVVDRVARDPGDLELEPGDRDDVAVAHLVLGIVRPHPRSTACDPVAQRLRLAGRRPDLGSGRLGQRGDSFHVVDVRVGDEDPCDRCSEPVELCEERRRISTRVDDRAGSRLVRGADEVAVRAVSARSARRG